MSLTRKLLRELELNEEAIERIIGAHAETVDALRAEAAAHQQETSRVQAAFDAFRLESEQARITAQRQSVLRETLTRAGVNELAVPLLAQTLSTADADWDGQQLRDAEAFLAPVREQYAGFFTRTEVLPTDQVSPPLEGSGSLTREDVRRMSASEINQHWPLVRSALAQERM